MSGGDVRGLSEGQKFFLKRFCVGYWCLDPDTGLVNIDGDFLGDDSFLTDFKGLRFGHVTGHFLCHNNFLSSLEGGPRSVGGNYLVYFNRLTSLEGAPERVGGNFNCSHNQILSLNGSPKETGWSFDCSYNRLSDLRGAPERVGGDFFAMNNRLTSVEGLSLDKAGQAHFYRNPIDSDILDGIWNNMSKRGMSYSEALRSLWGRLDLDTQLLMYRREFDWLGEAEIKKLDALKRFRQIQDLI